MFVRQALAGLFVGALLAAPADARLAEPLPAKPVDTARPRWVVPLAGPVESPFGYRWGRLHEGIDIGGFAVTRVRAALPGRVVAVGWLPHYSGYGLVIKIRHEDGVATMYAHLARSFVKRGDSVVGGQLIGRAGCTGSCIGVHLHFQVWVNRKLTDPMRFLKGRVQVR